MTRLVGAASLTKIDLLARFFLWRRRLLAAQLKTELLRADLAFQNLLRQFDAIQVENQQLFATRAEKQAALQVLTESHSSLIEEHARTVAALKAELLRADLAFQDLSHQFDAIQVENQQLFATRAENQAALQILTESHSSLIEEHARTVAALKATDEDYEALTKIFRELRNKDDLIGRLLNAKPVENDGISEYRRLLREEYATLTVQPPYIACRSDLGLLLQSVERELEFLAGFRGASNKSLVAVGGGFSSGKSEFLNSLINHPCIKLPTGIDPVTTIPCYVVSSASTYVRAYARNGGYASVDADLFKKLSHSFAKSLGFDLKAIMPFLAIGVPLDPRRFKDVCLLDTPGYNPPVTEGYTGSDRATARDYIRQSDGLIWVVGMDSSASAFPRSDLDFLRDLAWSGRPLYVVANKADLRPPHAVKDALEEFQAVLEDNDIEFIGICAYSSTQRREIFSLNMTLDNFLKFRNTATNAKQRVLDFVDTAFEQQEKALKVECKAARCLRDVVEKLHWDVLEKAQEDLFDQVNPLIEKLKTAFEPIKLEEHRQHLEELRFKFECAIRQVFAHMEQEQSS